MELSDSGFRCSSCKLMSIETANVLVGFQGGGGGKPSAHPKALKRASLDLRLHGRRKGIESLDGQRPKSWFNFGPIVERTEPYTVRGEGFVPCRDPRQVPKTLDLKSQPLGPNTEP